jgi:hypothetical protein
MSYNNCIVHPIGDDQLIAHAIAGIIPPLKNRKLVITRPVIVPQLYVLGSIVDCELIIMTSLNPSLTINSWCPGISTWQLFTSCTGHFK